MIKKLTLAGRFVFSAINVVGAALFAWAVLDAAVRTDTALGWNYVGLLAAALLTGLLVVKLPGINSIVSLSDTFVFVAVLFYGPLPAVIIAGADAFIATQRHSRRLLSALSSLSTMSISAFVAGTAYTWVLRSSGLSATGALEPQQLIVPLGVMSLVQYVANTTLVALLTAHARRRPVVRVWIENYAWMVQGFLIAGVTAGAAYLLLRRIGPAALLGSLPVLVATYISYRTYLGRMEEKNKTIARMNEVNLRALEALAAAAEARGQASFGHIPTVQAYAVGLAALVGMEEKDVEALRAAALLHDVGKLAVPDYILNKPGVLTAAERSKVMTYPRIGAEILTAVDFPYPVTPIVRHHRENWDGSGYPDGLKGEDIPLGARILGLVEAAVAMRQERTYRAALSFEAMCAELRAHAGNRFDPRLVELFLEHAADLDQLAQGNAVPALEGMEEIAREQREHAASLFARENGHAVFADISSVQREATALHDLARGLGATLGLEETVKVVMAKLRSLVTFDTGAIYLIDERSGLLLPALVDGENHELVRQRTLRPGEGITGWSFANGRTLVNAQPELDFYGAGVALGKVYHSAIVVPLKSGAGVSGTITLYDRRKNHFTSDDERILDLVAPEAAVAIRNASQYEATRDHAMTDPLTGLPNSRALWGQLEKELSRARRADATVAVVVLDLDRFKHVNDTFGHHIGDEVLRTVGGALRSRFRACDTVCRWGGDEFVVVLPDATSAGVEALVRDVRESIEGIVVPTPGASGASVGVSAGWAIYPEDGNSYEELIRMADKMMYRDKAAHHAAEQERTPARV